MRNERCGLALVLTTPVRRIQHIMTCGGGFAGKDFWQLSWFVPVLCDVLSRRHLARAGTDGLA